MQGNLGWEAGSSIEPWSTSMFLETRDLTPVAVFLLALNDKTLSKPLYGAQKNVAGCVVSRGPLFAWIMPGAPLKNEGYQLSGLTAVSLLGTQGQGQGGGESASRGEPPYASSWGPNTEEQLCGLAPSGPTQAGTRAGVQSAGGGQEQAGSPP